MVRVELPETSEVGLRLAVLPDGTPAVLSVTVPLKPFSGVTMMV
jgi:hypothetical protein